MKNTLLLFLCSLAGTVHASAQKDTALKYYNLCNKAELAICDSNIADAYQYYKQAFVVNTQKPFSQDLLNAFHCAIDLGYYDDAKQYLRRMLYRGVKQQYLKSQIYQFYTGKVLDSIQTFVALYPNDSNKQNAYALKMRELVGKDQGIRFYYIKKGIVAHMGDSVIQLDKAVSNELYQYFLVHGLKNADTIGHFGGEINNDLPYDVIVLHQIQAAARGTVAQLPYDDILYPGIFTYDYPPRYFLSKFFAGEKQSFLDKYPELKDLRGLNGAYYNDTLFIETIAPEDIPAIDEAYARMGLPKYQESVKKVAFRNSCVLLGGKFSKYTVQNTICSIMLSEKESGIKSWKLKFQACKSSKK